MIVLASDLSTLFNIIKLIFLLIIFVALLFGAHFFTKWYAKSGIVHAKTSNIEVVEVHQISPGKSIMIAKIGNKYISFIVFKEHATFLTELKEDELNFESKKEYENTSFKDMLKKMMIKHKDDDKDES